MIEFCIRFDESKVNSSPTYKLFLVGSIADFKKCIFKRLNREVCKTKDLEIKSSTHISNLVSGIDSNNFTYNLLVYLINHLDCSQDESGTIWYRFNIPSTNKYGSRTNLDLLIRLLEYGSDEIQPMMIFNSAFTEFKAKTLKKFNSIYY